MIEIEGKTEEEIIKLTAYVLGVSEAEAEVIIAIERGESVGDVIIDGQESAEEKSS